jgi:hypothetical protein
MNAMTIERLVVSARRLAKESQHVVYAAALCEGTRDAKVLSLCCGCAESRFGSFIVPTSYTDAAVWSPAAFRLPRGGECMGCSYVGHDCLLVLPDGVDLRVLDAIELEALS